MYSNQIPEPSLSAPSLQTSHLNLNVRISKSELNKTINHIVNTSFNEGFEMEDGYKIHTYISGPIDMQALQNRIITTLPLQVDIRPGGIFRSAKVKGTISLQLTTQIDIFHDQLLNKTSLTSHKWISKPVINLLGLNIPIEPIADYIVRKYQLVICESIDESINENFNIPYLRNSTRSFFDNPLYSTDDTKIHVFTNPLELSLGPMSMTDRDLLIPVLFYFETVISDEKPLDIQFGPSFSIRPFVDTSSRFYIQSRLPLPYLENILKEQTENQSFGGGLSRVTVNKISMMGYNKTLVMPMELSGAYNGKMELRFDPIYDKDDHKITLDNFKLHTYGGIKMKKILFSLIKGFATNKLRRSVENQINANITDYLIHLQKLLSGTEVLPGVIINGQLLDYEIKDILFFEQRMYFTISSKIKMNAEVKYIDTSKLIFEKP